MQWHWEISGEPHLNFALNFTNSVALGDFRRVCVISAACCHCSSVPCLPRMTVSSHGSCVRLSFGPANVVHQRMYVALAC